MAKGIIVLLFLLSWCESNAQTLFQKAMGGSLFEIGSTIRQTKDTGYIVAGRTLSFGSGGSDLFLTKLAADGSTLWSKTYGGTLHDSGDDVVGQTSDGGYILGGVTLSFGVFDNDLYLVRTDNSGNLLWSKTYSFTGQENFSGIVVNSDGGYTMLASVDGLNGRRDFSVIRTDFFGNIMWANEYGTDSNDVALSISKTIDGGYILYGNTTYIDPLGDLYLVKMDSAGTLQWSRIYGGTQEEMSANILQVSDSGYIFTGTTMSFGNGLTDAFLGKTDKAGNLLLFKTYGGPLHEYGNFVWTGLGINGYVLTGSTRGFEILYPFARPFLIKTDMFGVPYWAGIYGSSPSFLGDEFPVCTKSCFDGSIVFTGRTDNGGYGQQDVIITKVDGAGGLNGCEKYEVPFVTSPVLITGSKCTVFTPSVTVTSVISLSTIFSFQENVSCSVPLGINELSNDSFVFLYPNPSSGKFEIRCEKIKINRIEIYDVLGERIYSLADIHGMTNLNVDISSRPVGVYFVLVNTSEGMVSRKILLVK